MEKLDNSSKPNKEKIINQAIQLHLQGKILEAAKYYQYCLNQGFNDHRVFSNYGIIVQSLGKSKQAETLFRKAIEIKPDFTEAHNNLGNILKDLGKLKDAEISVRKAIELNPNFAMAHVNLGSILIDFERLKEAELSTRKTIELNPNFAEAYSNLGNILMRLGRLQEAEIPYKKAIALNPDYAQGHYNLSHLELLIGDYQSGLENYEFRFKKKKQPDITHGNTKLKRLNNQPLQTGEKLLVISEQGFGDTLHFMRYIPYLRQQGIDVSFCAQTQLHSLIKASGIDTNPLTPEQASLVSEGLWIPLLSVPRYLKVRPDNPIISNPYIYSTDELNKKWREILSPEKRPIIGINWQGNPNAEKASAKGRSLPLETFSTLAKHHNFNFLSLQKGFGSEQLEHCSFKNQFVQCQSQINSTWDFLENAAIIENCDLIITSDTSIAHLAGGMGKSTWVLLKHVPEWRWGIESENTFWYPSIRLFRQQTRQNWHEVIEKVSIALNLER